MSWSLYASRVAADAIQAIPEMPFRRPTWREFPEAGQGGEAQPEPRLARRPRLRRSFYQYSSIA